MEVTKILDTSNRIMPLVAALPYSIRMDEQWDGDVATYDPQRQKTLHAGGSSSTCREDESVHNGNLFTKSDTKRDD